MKRFAAAILALLMIIALLPAAAADADFVLEIEGGPYAEHTETVDGEECLKVEIRLHGVKNTQKLSALYFECKYDPSLITPVTYQTAKTAAGTVNVAEAGMVRFAFASGSGVLFTDGDVLLTVWFRLSETVINGTVIAFTLGNTEGESIGPNGATPRTVGCDFRPFTVSGLAPKPIEGATIEWNANDVQFNKKTPFVLYNGKAQTPRFIVKDENGSVIDASYYDYEFKENTLAGTAYLFVTFKNGLSGTCDSFFKIYLPATKQTTVENVKEGIKITWAPVEGAAGYVIYRRAWSSTTNGWTSFERWWNVTETTWTDGTIENHMVYAGTRYQYGIKAYFAKRLDPISGDYIGGNENIPLGNWNLGIVGPLRTTVRITTRVLNEVVGGSNQVTVKWAKSANFTGYEVQIATDANFTNIAETKIIDNWKIGEATFQGLKANTTYYARVRSYHEFEGFTYYGEWSNVLSAKTN